MNKEPFLQVSKRRNKAGWQERLLIRFIALILALIVCGAVIVALVKMNPVDVYKAIWDGAMGSERRIWQTIRDTMVLLCIAIGLAPAFKMKFWNIGAEGQILIGGACSAAVMIYAGDKMSPVILLIVMFIASALGGMIWGMIPAVFKAYWNTNETLFTLMLNYVAMQVVTYCIVFWENPKGSNTVGIINQATQAGWLPELFGQKYGWNVLIVLILTVGMFIQSILSRNLNSTLIHKYNTKRYSHHNKSIEFGKPCNDDCCKSTSSCCCSRDCMACTTYNNKSCDTTDCTRDCHGTDNNFLYMDTGIFCSIFTLTNYSDLSMD